MGHFALSKSERLCREKEIQHLFQKGASLLFYPIRITYLPLPAGALCSQALFSVPKRHFRRAVDRNKIKRRMREAYRLNKAALPPARPHQLAFVYIGTDLAPYEVIQKSLVRALEKIAPPQA